MMAGIGPDPGVVKPGGNIGSAGVRRAGRPSVPRRRARTAPGDPPEPTASGPRTRRPRPSRPAAPRGRGGRQPTGGRLEAVAAADPCHAARSAPRSRLSSETAAKAATVAVASRTSRHGRAPRRPRWRGGPRAEHEPAPRRAIDATARRTSGYRRTTTMPAAIPTSTGTAAISGSKPATARRSSPRVRRAPGGGSAPPIASATTRPSSDQPCGLTRPTARSSSRGAGPRDRTIGTTVAATTVTAIATTAAVAADRGRAGAPPAPGPRRAAATIAPGTAMSRPSTTAGPSTCRPEAPRLRASDIVARRRRAARTAISARVATPTSAGPSAITAMIPAAAAQRAAMRLEDRRHAGAQRGVVGGRDVRRGVATMSRWKSATSRSGDRSSIRVGSRNSRHE